jgi:carbonic anhydrase
MNHGSKQMMAWIVAIGFSGAIYGGGALWLSQSKFAPHTAAAVHGHEDLSPGKATEHDSPSHDANHGEGSAAPKSEDTHHKAHSSDAANSDDHTAVPSASETAKENTAHADTEHHETPHETPHWTYGKADAAGPAQWGRLAENFSKCERGMEQSPIDVKSAQFSAIIPKVQWHYSAATVLVENNGHTIQSNIAPRSAETNFVTIDGERYSLAQFHFHNPSEHRFAGAPADMELHFVHKNNRGKLAVIGVMIHEIAGKENINLKPIWDVLPRELHQKSPQPITVRLQGLLPTQQRYVHYKGSLTTPPCSEGVQWFVMKDPISISSGQLEMYTSIFEGTTNRPVQPLHKREVLTNATPALAH